MKCGICNKEWAICIPNTVHGGQINLCAKHRDIVQEAQHQALKNLLEEDK